MTDTYIDCQTEEQEEQGYHHVILRFQHEGGRVFSNRECVEYAGTFAKSWNENQKAASSTGLVVFHGYPEGEVGGNKVPHIHVVYKPHKTSKATELIGKFQRQHAILVYRDKVQSLQGITKYLLQGQGRQVLCQTGRSVQGRLHTSSGPIQPCGEATCCESYAFRRTNEGIWSASPPAGEAIEGTPGSYSASEISKAQRSALVANVKELSELMLKYRIKDEPSLMRKMTHDEKLMFTYTKVQTKEWNKVWDQARTEALTSIMDKWWEETLEMLPDDPLEYTPPVMPINKSLKVLTQLLQHQGYDQEKRKQFMKDVYCVMNNNKMRRKRNTLYIIGEVPSGGKTLVATSLERSKIFSFNTGEYNARSSDFHWEDMAMAAIAIINEPQIEAGKIDKFKVILEGGAFDTNVKFKSKARVEGVPVIVTTNLEIWRYAQEATAPFQERIYRHEFKKMLPNIGITNGLHPKLWLSLIRYYKLDKSMFVEAEDDQFDISTFAGTVSSDDDEDTYLDDASMVKIAEQSQALRTEFMWHIPEEGRNKFDDLIREVCSTDIFEFYITDDFFESFLPGDDVAWIDGEFKFGQSLSPGRHSARSCHNYVTTIAAFIGVRNFKRLLYVWQAFSDVLTYGADVFSDGCTATVVGYHTDALTEQLKQFPRFDRDLHTRFWSGVHGFGNTGVDILAYCDRVYQWYRSALMYILESIYPDINTTIYDNWQYDPATASSLGCAGERRRMWVLHLQGFRGDINLKLQLDGWTIPGANGGAKRCIQSEEHTAEQQGGKRLRSCDSGGEAPGQQLQSESEADEVQNERDEESDPQSSGEEMGG